eukprot:103217_1
MTSCQPNKDTQSVQYTVRIDSTLLPLYAEPIDESVSSEFRENKVWILSPTDKWRQCCIIDEKLEISETKEEGDEKETAKQIAKNYIKVHYFHFDVKYDEWLEANSNRISNNKPDKVTPHYIESGQIPKLALKYETHGDKKYIIAKSKVYSEIIPGSQLMQINDQNVIGLSRYDIDMMLEDTVNHLQSEAHHSHNLQLTFEIKDKKAFDIGVFFEVQISVDLHDSQKSIANDSKFKRLIWITNWKEVLSQHFCHESEDTTLELFDLDQIDNGLNMICFTNIDPIFFILNKWIQHLDLHQIFMFDLQRIVKMYYSDMKTEHNIECMLKNPTDLKLQIVEDIFGKSRFDIAVNNIIVQYNKCGFGMRNKYWSYEFYEKSNSERKNKKKLAELVYRVNGNDQGRNAWYYVLVDEEKLKSFLKALNDETIHLDQYGVILYSGYGEEPPKYIIDDVKKKFMVDNHFDS